MYVGTLLLFHTATKHDTTDAPTRKEKEDKNRRKQSSSQKMSVNWVCGSQRARTLRSLRCLSFGPVVVLCLAREFIKHWLGHCSAWREAYCSVSDTLAD